MEGIGVVVSLVVGTVVVVMVLGIIVRRDGWADLGEREDSVEHAYLRRVAEARLSSLSSGAIRLAQKERGACASRDDSAAAREFWRRFAAASASVEKDPAAALEGMRDLPGLLDEALREAERRAVATGGAPRREDGR